MNQPEKGEVTGRVNSSGISALSRRLMAIERARALGRRPVDLRAYALEKEAQHWTEKELGRGSQEGV